ncbi:hypothetical protein BC332_30895 [Capsicum chinense]|nr:hypothetical protein BC332_30895 [Capsicum chinense]
MRSHRFTLHVMHDAEFCRFFRHHASLNTGWTGQEKLTRVLALLPECICGIVGFMAIVIWFLDLDHSDYLVTNSVCKNHIIRKFQNLPPNPYISLPIIDHLYLLKKPLHKTLAKISEKHGPLLFLRFGSRPVLLVSSPSLAEECFTKNDVVFASRPRLLAGKHLGYNYATLVWASYGQHWRNLRRIATLEILSTQRIQMFSDIRRDEVRALLQHLVRGKTNGRDPKTNTVDMKAAFFEMTLNILTMMIAGKRYYSDSGERLEESRRFKEIVREFPTEWCNKYRRFCATS